MNRPGVGVGVFIKKQNNFLMVKRHGSHGEGTWSVPGGWMEYGETFKETARREVLEEVGLEIKNIRFGAVTGTVFENEGIHSITIWLLSDHASNEPRILEPEKISELDWKNFGSLPKPLFKPWNDLLSSEFISSIKKQLQ